MHILVVWRHACDANTEQTLLSHDVTTTVIVRRKCRAVFSKFFYPWGLYNGFCQNKLILEIITDLLMILLPCHVWDGHNGLIHSLHSSTADHHTLRSMSRLGGGTFEYFDVKAKSTWEKKVGICSFFFFWFVTYSFKTTFWQNLNRYK